MRNGKAHIKAYIFLPDGCDVSKEERSYFNKEQGIECSEIGKGRG